MQVLPIDAKFLAKIERDGATLDALRELLGIEDLTSHGDAIIAALDAGKTASQIAEALTA
jgi:hypothetical protein